MALPQGPNQSWSQDFAAEVSTIGRLRDVWLSESLFESLRGARRILETWRNDYNIVRSQSALRNVRPSTCANVNASGVQWAKPLSYCRAPRPGPLHRRVRAAQTNKHSTHPWMKLELRSESPGNTSEARN